MDVNKDGCLAAFSLTYDPSEISTCLTIETATMAISIKSSPLYLFNRIYDAKNITNDIGFRNLIPDRHLVCNKAIYGAKYNTTDRKSGYFS